MRHSQLRTGSVILCTPHEHGSFRIDAGVVVVVVVVVVVAY